MGATWPRFGWGETALQRPTSGSGLTGSRFLTTLPCGAEVSLLQGEGSAWCWLKTSGKRLTVWMTQVSTLYLLTTGLLNLQPNHPRQNHLKEQPQNFPEKPRILADPKHLPKLKLQCNVVSTSRGVVAFE